MTWEEAKREMMFAKRNVLADSYIDQAYDKAIEALSQSEPKRGEIAYRYGYIVEPTWIPATERLPDIGEHYTSEPCLCYCSNGAYCFGELEENIFGQVGWNCERDDDYHEAVGEVIAWMPLPKPYEGGENDD